MKDEEILKMILENVNDIKRTMDSLKDELHTIKIDVVQNTQQRRSFSWGKRELIIAGISFFFALIARGVGQ